MKRISLLILASILLFAGRGVAADKWLTVRSKNVFLVGNASESAIRVVARNLEEFRAAIVTLFPRAGGQASVATTVFVFKDDASFRPYKPLYEGKPANVAGYFQAGPDVNFITLTGSGDALHVIYHEYLHSLVKDSALRMPLWVNEGLAEFYSTLEMQGGGKEVLIGKVLQKQAGEAAEDERRDRLKLMRTHLKRTIELAPQFIEAYSWLGYVTIGLREELAETESLLKKAVSLAPGRQELSLDLAQLMIANDETLPARAVLAPLKNSTDSTIRNQTEKLLDVISGRLENEQAFRDYERRRQALSQADNVDQNDKEHTTQEPDAPPKLARPAPPTSRDSAVETPKIENPGLQIAGVLTLIDCTHGATLRLRVGTGNVELHSDDPSRIQFISNVTDVKGTIACGPVDPSVAVTITYRRTTDPRFLGEPILVTFVEKK